MISASCSFDLESLSVTDYELTIVFYFNTLVIELYTLISRLFLLELPSSFVGLLSPNFNGVAAFSTDFPLS